MKTKFQKGFSQKLSPKLKINVFDENIFWDETFSSNMSKRKNCLGHLNLFSIFFLILGVKNVFFGEQFLWKICDLCQKNRDYICAKNKKSCFIA
jgi:hypothetical protein